MEKYDNVTQNVIKENIKTLIDDIIEISIRRFAVLVHLGDSNLSRKLRGIQPITKDDVKKICSSINVNRQWLETGQGEPFGAPKVIEAVEESPGNLVNVPVVSQYAYGGYLTGYADEEFMESLPTIPFQAEHEVTGNYVAFEVRGDSMDDGTKFSYVEGETVICREVCPCFWKDSKLHIHKRDFVIVHKDGILVKRIAEHDVEHHTITIHSLNPEYPDRTLDLADVRQIFSIVASQMQRKR